MDSTGGVDVGRSCIGSATCVTVLCQSVEGGFSADQDSPVDPLEPVLSTMTGDKVLQIICKWNALRLRCAEEVVADWVLVVAEGDLDWTLKAVKITVLASSLVCLMLLHQWDQFFCGPALGKEVCCKPLVFRTSAASGWRRECTIVVGGGGTGVHLSVSQYRCGKLL